MESIYTTDSGLTRYNQKTMDKTTKTHSEVKANPWVTVLIIVGALALVAVLILLARAPGIRKADSEAGYRPPPVLSGVNPADKDAIAILKLALESDDPKKTVNAAYRLAYLAIPELKEGMLSLKERGLIWDYIQLLPELYHLGYENAEGDLSEYLESADLQMVVSALEALERMPPLSCREAFVDCLKQPHMDMAIGCSKVLRKWRKSDDEINEILLNIIHNAPVDFSQVAAAAALYDVGAEKDEAWEKIRYWSENADMELAPSLVSFLRYSGDPRAGETIALMLEKPLTRVAALGGLVNVDWPGKLEAIDQYKDGATSAEANLIVVIHEADTGESRLDEILTSLLSESREDGTGVKLNESQRIMSINGLVTALKEWHSPRVLPYFERIIEDAPRVLRMEVSRALRKFEGNRKAIDMAMSLLKRAEDERELIEHATTLGYIDGGRSAATLHDLMVNTNDDDAKLTLAWAILNINRNHPHRYPKR